MVQQNSSKRHKKENQDIYQGNSDEMLFIKSPKQGDRSEFTPPENDT